MLTNILRRGGALRFAALGLLAASILSFGLNGSNQPDEAHAHGSGILYCGTAPFAGNLFDYEYTTWDEWPAINWHVWNNETLWADCQYYF